jgi:hypothetical protein
MASNYDEAASQDAVRFDAPTQLDLLRLTQLICSEEKWCIEGAGFDPSHMHVAISWRIRMTWNEVDRRLKNLLSLKLNREKNTPAKRWFARRHGAPRRVMTREHLSYLLQTYFPDHPGVYWCKGTSSPRLRK